MVEEYDIIIVGSGMGGGTLLHELAPTGKRILVLERGPFLPREKDNWDTKAVFTDEKYKSQETWLDKDDNSFRPGIHYFVGGNTKMYGAALFRLRERDFEESAHIDGISPAWPISYDDLKDYYTKAEHLYSVHGLRGSDPTEPPESATYPHEPLPHEPRIQRLFDDFTKLGLKPFPLPMGVREPAATGRSHAPANLDRFDGYPDPSETKADAHVCAVEPSLQYENVTLKTERYVERLNTNAAGTCVEEVMVWHNGQEEHYTAPIVVVSAGAINSATLMLRSASDQHPQGLGNRNDLIGRHYMAHNNSAFVAIGKETNETIFGKTFGMNDFYLNSGDEDFPYPLGHMQMLAKSDGELFRAETPALFGEWVPEKIAAHAVDFWLTTEDLPLHDNRITLEEDGQIRIAYTPTNEEAHHRLKKKIESMLEGIGCEAHLIPRSIYIGKKIDVAGTAHQNGTLRFGTDPETSVLDLNCKMHELQNVYVVDASFFVSSGAINPSLTIAANALRVADHLKTII